MTQPKRRTSDSTTVIRIGGISVTMRNLAILIALTASLCGSAWAAGSAYATITGNQGTILERMTENDVRVAELAKAQADTENRNLQLEREIVFLRKDLESETQDRWTSSDDKLFMTEFSAANNLNMQQHGRNGQ